MSPRFAGPRDVVLLVLPSYQILLHIVSAWCLGSAGGRKIMSLGFLDLLKFDHSRPNFSPCRDISLTVLQADHPLHVFNLVGPYGFVPLQVRVFF